MAFNFIRKYLKEFAATNKNTSLQVFGSKSAGSPFLSDDPEVLQSEANFGLGWVGATIFNPGNNTRSPIQAEWNALQYIHNYQTNYILQKGIPEYNAGTSYFISDITRPLAGTTLYKSATDNNLDNDTTGNSAYNAGTSYSIGDRALDTNGDIYVSLTDVNIGNPLTDPVEWELTWVFLVNLQVATTQETLDQNNQKILTPFQLFNFLPFQEWTVGNSDTSLGQVLPTGDPSLVTTIGYDLLTTLLEASELLSTNIPVVFKDVSDSPQATLLDETNNKFLFPSNLNTFNSNYAAYSIRITIVVDIASTINNTNKFYIRLRRVVDDSFIAVVPFLQSDFPAETGVPLMATIPTFVEGELDPFIIDGAYLDILSDTNSFSAITLQSLTIKIFRK